jgi:hypothetical protein
MRIIYVPFFFSRLTCKYEPCDKAVYPAEGELSKLLYFNVAPVHPMRMRLTLYNETVCPKRGILDILLTSNCR